ncbi:MAG: phosphotransferase family protein [Syntrophobacterales bacterium]|nr:phosphotransferase family protein [Syntrophobacterales bacterium]
MDVADETRPIREGEEFDIKRVEQFLKDNIPQLKGALTVSQFPGGHSNLTYLIRVGDRELVFRRPPLGRKAKTAHDMGREFRMLQALRPAFPYCPEPLAYTDDETLIGCPFYVMERIKGLIIRRDLPKSLALQPKEAARLCEKLIAVFVELHQVDYRKIGLEDFGKPAGYVKRQVEGWSERYRTAKTPDAPDFEDVMAWLHEKMPPESPHVSVIHNDYRFDNVVLHPDDPFRIVGVLDWEMATIGDPLMDLGGALAYWTNHDDPPAMQAIRMIPTHLPGMFTRQEFIKRYSERMGIPVEKSDFYYCFGMFRLAGIVQQIYWRFYHGQTKDERFKLMIAAVQVLEAACKRLIEKSVL